MKIFPDTLVKLFSRPPSDRDALQPDRLDTTAPSPNNTPLFGPYYDAAQDSPARSQILNFPLTARREFTPYVRRIILQKLRSIEANLGLVQRMKSQVSKYAVGFGIFPVPQTSDTDWNEQARARFMDWANNPSVCDVAGAMNFWERQRYHAETFFAENESFDALISSSVSGAPQLQLIDNGEVGFGAFGVGSMDPDVIDGVRVNEQYRPISYLIADQQPGAYFYELKFREIPAPDLIHIIKRKRANQLRGISPFAPAINPAIDVMDLDSVILASAKLHNAMGITVNKKSGEAGKKGITGQVKKLIDDDGKVTRVDEKFIRGAIIQYLGLDEELNIVSSDRPTQNLLDYLIYRLRHICLTTGLPFEIVWDLATLGGATARIALADAQWFFDGIQDVLNDRFNQRTWVWWAASMMKNGQLRTCLDPRWWNCHWQGPPKLTADAGRKVQEDVLGLQNGLLGWEDYYAARGANYKDKIGRQIQALAWAMDQAKKAGVPFEYVYSLKPGTPQTGSGDGNGDQQQEAQ